MEKPDSIRKVCGGERSCEAKSGDVTVQKAGL